MIIKFDLIECEAGWQAEGHIKDFTFYGPVCPTKEKAILGVSKFSTFMKWEYEINPEPKAYGVK